jgi:hypothetical protein
MNQVNPFVYSYLLSLPKLSKHLENLVSTVNEYAWGLGDKVLALLGGENLSNTFSKQNTILWNFSRNKSREIIGSVNSSVINFFIYLAEKNVCAYFFPPEK